MKQALSIFLLLAGIFNLGGYGLFMATLEDRANEKLEQSLDNNRYDTTMLVSLKVPLTLLAYYNNSPFYERKSGQIEINGVIYNYVKQRIYNDSVEVLCIPGVEAMKMRRAQNDYFKLNNGLQATGQNKKNNTSTVSKFFSPGNCIEKRVSKQADVYQAICKSSIRPFIILPIYYATVIENPPECIYQVSCHLLKHKLLF